MAKFTLQRVLELRERKEQALAIRLAHARSRAEEVRNFAAAIEAKRQESEAQMRAGAAMVTTAGAIQTASFVVARLDEQLAQARKAVQTVEAEVEVCLTEFTVALQERQVLDRLKEKRLSAAFLEENKAEQATNDAIALSRFFRRGSAAAGGNP